MELLIDIYLVTLLVLNNRTQHIEDSLAPSNSSPKLLKKVDKTFFKVHLHECFTVHINTCKPELYMTWLLESCFTKYHYWLLSKRIWIIYDTCGSQKVLVWCKQWILLPSIINDLMCSSVMIIMVCVSSTKGNKHIPNCSLPSATFGFFRNRLK
jgi:hypothetical protein